MIIKKIVWNMIFTRRHKSYLQRGEYHFLPNMRTVVAKDSQICWQKIFPVSRRNKKKDILYSILKQWKCIVRENGNEFVAEAVYFSNTNDNKEKVIKFFDFSLKQVLTLCQSEKEYLLFLKNRAEYSAYYRVPSLIRSDDKKLEYVEELIQKQDYDLRQVYNALLKIYIESFRKQGPKQEKNVCEKPEWIITNNITCPEYSLLCLQHGDLSLDNFICDSEDIVFIDFEHQGYYPLFYDLFFLIANSYVVNHNELGFNLLREKTYRDYLDSVCRAFGSSLSDCFVVFTQAFYQNRLKNYIGSEAEKKYSELFIGINRLLNE